jgi:hypothetical protein
MTDDRLFEMIDPVLRAMGSTLELGEEFRDPPLDLLRYYRRPVRLNRVPLVGRALSVVAVVRQPMDVGLSVADYTRLLARVARASNGRFPPWKGLVIGLTVIVLTPEPIGPGEDAVLSQTLEARMQRHRVVPFGLIRVNLGQEAIAFSLRQSPEKLFPEAERLADVLSESLRRYVPLIEM